MRETQDLEPHSDKPPLTVEQYEDLLSKERRMKQFFKTQLRRLQRFGSIADQMAELRRSEDDDDDDGHGGHGGGGDMDRDGDTGHRGRQGTVHSLCGGGGDDDDESMGANSDDNDAVNDGETEEGVSDPAEIETDQQQQGEAMEEMVQTLQQQQHTLERQLSEVGTRMNLITAHYALIKQELSTLLQSAPAVVRRQQSGLEAQIQLIQSDQRSFMRQFLCIGHHIDKLKQFKAAADSVTAAAPLDEVDVDAMVAHRQQIEQNVIRSVFKESIEQYRDMADLKAAKYLSIVPRLDKLEQLVETLRDHVMSKVVQMGGGSAESPDAASTVNVEQSQQAANETTRSQEHAAALMIQKEYRRFRQRRRFMTIVDQFVRSPVSRTHRNRLEVMREILQSERQYVSYLDSLIHLYVHPCKKIAQSGGAGSGVFSAVAARVKSGGSNTGSWLSMDNVNTMFINIEQIHATHKMFLLNLEVRFQDYPLMYLGDIFTSQAPLFLIYTSYVNRYDAARNTKRTLSRTVPRFAKLCSDAEGHALARGHSLDSLMIMPIQRLPRYKLLVRELLKHTPEDHMDYTALINAYSQISGIVEMINEKKHQYEDQLMCSEVGRIMMRSERGKRMTRFLRPQTPGVSSYQVHGPCTVFINGKKPMNRTMYLFRDLLVFTRTEERKNIIGQSTVREVFDFALEMSADKVSLDPSQLQIAVQLDLPAERDFIHLCVNVDAESQQGVRDGVAISMLSIEPQKERLQDTRRRWFRAFESCLLSEEQLIEWKIKEREQRSRSRASTLRKNVDLTNLWALYEKMFSRMNPHSENKDWVQSLLSDNE